MNNARELIKTLQDYILKKRKDDQEAADD